MQIGDRVVSLPGCLAYFCGDKSGVVEAFDGTSIMVRMDQSKRLVPFRSDQLRIAWEQDAIDDHLFADDDGECFMCGGSGELDECECSAFEDVCCCLHPVPRECPECIARERDAKQREQQIAAKD